MSIDARFPGSGPPAETRPPAARARMPVRRLVAGALPMILALGCGGQSAEPDQAAAAATGSTFVGREACAPCHADQMRMWQGSHHDLAMQEANERTVLGDFDDATFTYNGVTSTFFRRAGAFFVRTDGPDGELADYEIAYTFGVVPLQQYLIEFPGGRLQTLSICWDTRPAQQGGQRWFHLYPDQAVDHRDPLHWTGLYQNWNHMCSECHSTDVWKNYRPESDSFETSWQEIDVSCEACHGPGSEHVEWAKAVEQGKTPRPVEHFGLGVRLEDPARDTWLVNPETGLGMRLAPPVETREVETCARCHSRRGRIREEYVFGRPLLDTHRLALLEEELYHPDGQIFEEVYVHGSWIQSRMQLKGVTCSDCHDPHTLGLRLPGDDVCARCHAASKFDTPEHHFHKPETEGAHCVDCHMVPRTYMVVDPRHDHAMRIPRPDLSLELGTPNACNDCHRDKSVGWSLEWVARWYGPGRRLEPHWGEAILAGREGSLDAEEKLAALAGDPEKPGIARATALDLLGRYLTAGSLGVVEQALADPDPLVRYGAVEAAEALAPEALVGLLSPLLADPVRVVRLQATRVLAEVPAEHLTAEGRRALSAGLAEFREAQLVDADRVEGRLSLGWLNLVEGDLEAAQRELERAVELGPWSAAASVNLAEVLRRRGRDEEGERVLRRGLETSEEPAVLHHTLGLLLVRGGRLPEALAELERAVELEPSDPRFGYVLGVGLHSAGQSARAVEVLEEAHKRAPADRDLLVALATINRDRGERAAAVSWARRLVEQVPEDPAARRLLAELEGQG